MMRFTTYLLLASFLHLQTACCCGVGDAHGLPASAECSAEAPDHGADCPCSHRQAVTQADGCAQSTFERDPHHHQTPQHQCHLCVITHLKYVGPTAAPQLDHLLTCTFAPANMPRLVVYRTFMADHSLSLRHNCGSLFSCGSLLRI